MNIRCRLGRHRWQIVTNEMVRNGKAKLRLQWLVCARNCGAVRTRGKTNLTEAR